MGPLEDTNPSSHSYYGPVFNNYGSVNNQAGQQNVQGNLNSIYPTGSERAQNDYSLGVNLGDAPILDSSLFVGRDSYLESMREALEPKSHPGERAIVVLGGVGGVGKTQTAIAFAKRYRSLYSSIFWLNATSEIALKQSLRQIAQRVLGPDTAGKYDDEMIQAHVLNWMSERDNNAWLMIFDNHDEPEAYRITQYFPYASHGSVIITSRLLDFINGKQIRLQTMSDDGDEIKILESRSGRKNLVFDHGALQLVKRLGGLPLALATAGASLKQSTLSPAEYMKLYEAKWEILPICSSTLPEYQDRNLFTTWNVSFAQLQRMHPHAARLLELTAYLDHQMLWYDLLQAGRTSDSPTWFMEVTRDRSKFEEAMGLLVNFGLAQVQHETATYSLHACIHDWTLHGLNERVNPSLYRLAFDCIVGSLQAVEDLSEFRLGRLIPHAVHLAQDDYRTILFQEAIFPSRFLEIMGFSRFLMDQDQHVAPQSILEGIKARCEDGRIADSDISHIVGCELGFSYAFSGRLTEAEYTLTDTITRNDEEYRSKPINDRVLIRSDFRILWRNLKRPFKSTLQSNLMRSSSDSKLWPEAWSPLLASRNLAVVYELQGRICEAKPMLRNALAKAETAYGPDSWIVLSMMEMLMRVAFARGEMAEAETLALRALTLSKKINRTDDILLRSLSFLGRLYILTSRPTEATRYCQEMIWRGEHILNQAPSSRIVIVCSYAFALKIKLLTANYSEGLSCINSLNRLAQEYGQGLFSTYTFLSQGLMSMGGLENARLAYQYGVVLRDRLQFGNYERCDGCCTLLKAKCRVYLCRQCFDLSFCEECMGQYANLGEVVPYCSGHEFLDVDLMNLPELNRVHIELWHQSIGKKYGANQD